MLETIKKVIPKQVRMRIRRAYPGTVEFLNNLGRGSKYFFQDTMELATGKRDPLTPPKRMIFVGNGDFRGTGNEFFHYFVQLAGLQPHEKVLEVGCGIGRMAVPLMGYLKDGGTYDGFDIVRSGIRWCQKYITPRASHFHFRLADIYNSSYNPAGRFKAVDYPFPYEDGSFDFVFLTSVFTHMLPPDMEHYLCEIRRVLKEGGRCFITYFLLDKESLELTNAGVSTIDFKYKAAGYEEECRIMDIDVPESAVAFTLEYIEQLYKKNRLEILPPIRNGHWCGRKECLSYQDMMLARKVY
jgi:SAM-dependent methyltransferase